jgi:phosphoglycolate phosphatase-like HAD superfamily hydrolase
MDLHTRRCRYMRFVPAGLDGLLSGLTSQDIRIGALSDYPTDAKLDALGVRPLLLRRLVHDGSFRSTLSSRIPGVPGACTHWGLAPQEVLYVGDRPEIDAAGAAAAGSAASSLAVLDEPLAAWPDGVPSSALRRTSRATLGDALSGTASGRTCRSRASITGSRTRS